MSGTPAIRNLIREDKVAQMYSAIQTGGSLGMQTLDSCLKTLVTKGIVSREAAREKPKRQKISKSTVPGRHSPVGFSPAAIHASAAGLA